MAFGLPPSLIPSSRRASHSPALTPRPTPHPGTPGSRRRTSDGTGIEKAGVQVTVPWTQRPCLSIREVAKLTGDTIQGVEAKVAEGRLRGPEDGLVWPAAVQEVYSERPRSRALPRRLARIAEEVSRDAG